MSSGYINSYVHDWKGECINQYTFISHLGSGSYSHVWKVEKDDVQYAIKVILSIDKHVADREIEIFNTIEGTSEQERVVNTSSHSIHLIDHFTFHNKTFLVLPLATCSLYDVMIAHQLDLSFVKYTIKQILMGLCELNELGLYHTDIKPENILLFDYVDVDQLDFTVKIGDLGSCITDSELSEPHTLQTRYYRSPEVICKKPRNATCDIWSIGCMTYELLTGKLLFDPTKTRKSRDRHHMEDIQTILGKYPRSRFKVKSRIPIWALLWNVIENHHDRFVLCDFLYKTLEYDINKRLTPSECLNHLLIN